MSMQSSAGVNFKIHVERERDDEPDFPWDFQTPGSRFLARVRGWVIMWVMNGIMGWVIVILPVQSTAYTDVDQPSLPK